MSKKNKSHSSIVPGNTMATKVIGKDINFALRTWKKQTKSANILETLKSKKEYTKPSVIKRKQLIDARYKQKISDLRNNY